MRRYRESREEIVERFIADRRLVCMKNGHSLGLAYGQAHKTTAEGYPVNGTYEFYTCDVCLGVPCKLVKADGPS